MAEAERKIWKAKADDLETEIVALRKRLTTADGKARQSERDKEELDSAIAKLRHELSIKERELQRTEMTVNALSDVILIEFN